MGEYLLRKDQEKQTYRILAVVEGKGSPGRRDLHPSQWGIWGHLRQGGGHQRRTQEVEEKGASQAALRHGILSWKDKKTL